MSSDRPPRQYTTHDCNINLHQCLATSIPTKPALPAELILQILDQPSRWISTYATFFPNSEASENRPIIVDSGFDGGASIHVILSTPPLTSQEITTIRSIVLTFTSIDQGWSSYPEEHGTYEGSWSWFEAGLRSDTRGGYGPVVNDHGGDTRGQEMDRYVRFRLQSNRHAGREPETYKIEFGQESPLLQKMKAGDVIDLLACAQYPGWRNIVHEAGIEIFSFDDPKNQ
ncbi:MAG: hypothetical protein Q9164_005689 [Protoblastenia rupestris]